MISNNKGVTLIELVVSITVMSVIILVSVTVLNFGQKTFTTNDKMGQLQSEASYLSSIITTQVRESNTIITGTAILLTLGFRDGSNASFSVTGNTLTMTDRTGIAKTLSTDISSSFFNVTGSGIGVQINIALSSGGQNMQLVTTAYKRF